MKLKQTILFVILVCVVAMGCSKDEESATEIDDYNLEIFTDDEVAYLDNLNRPNFSDATTFLSNGQSVEEYINEINPGFYGRRANTELPS